MATNPGTAAATLALGVVMSLVLSALSQAIVLFAAFEDMRGRPVNLLEPIKIGLRLIVPVVGVALANAQPLMPFEDAAALAQEVMREPDCLSSWMAQHGDTPADLVDDRGN